MLSWKSVILLGLTALLLLSGGQCVFIATSGNTKDDKHDDTGGATVIVIATGRFIDAPVQGLRYVSGSTTGVTGSDGEFEYEVDGSITFAIGDIVLGNEIRGKEIVTPLDLIPGATVDTTAALNIARLLQSLDATQDDGIIVIPPALHEKAVLTSDSLHAAIQSLDYADETAFVNAASQLVATLTEHYPFTATLVDGERARRRMIESFSENGIREAMTRSRP
jgi:hypothetical protein